MLAWPPTMPPLRDDRETRRGPAASRLPSNSCPSGTGSSSDAPAPIEGDPPAGLDALLGGLNPEQLKAVTHGDGPLLVVAGAGTGKTQVITRRIAWLIATRRAKPSEILALTFTEKAAAEMQVRVDQLVPYGYTDAAIGTFHAFGDRIIREYALELGLPTDVRVLTRPEVVIFLREHLFEFDLDLYRPLGDPTRFLGRAGDAVQPLQGRGHLAGGLPRARGPARRARRSRHPDDEALAEEARRQGELARAYARYQELLAANGFIDFGDQVNLALRLVRTSRRGPAGAPVALQVRPRRRVPGHEPGPVGARLDPRRAASERHGRRRRRPVDLQVPGRGDQQHPRVPRSLPGRPDGRPPAQLPLARADPRRVVPARPLQRSGSAGGPGRDLEAAAAGAQTETDAPRRPPRGVRDPRRGGGLDRRGDRRRIAGGRPAARPRRPRPGQRPRGPDPAQPQRRRDPVAVLRDVRAVCPAGGPPAARVPAGDRGPRRRASTSTPSPTAEPYGLGGEDLTSIVNTARRRHRSVWEVLEELERQPGILRLSPRRGPRVTRFVADLRRFTELAHERPAGEVLYRFLRGLGDARPARGERHRRGRGGAPQHRPVLRHRPGPVGAARRRPGDVRRAPPPDADRGRRRPADRGSRPRRRRGRGPDGPQGEGPRVPGRVHARPRRGPVPDARAARAARAAARAASRRRCRRATSSCRRSAGSSTSA